MTKMMVTICLIILVAGIPLISLVHFYAAQNSSFVNGTFVNGIIASNSTWTKANSPYTLTGPVLVNNGVTLTIEPGVTVNLESYYIEINGNLVAQGSSTDKIHFRGGNITFTMSNSSSSEQAVFGSIIENAIFTSTSITSYVSLTFDYNSIDSAINISATSKISNNIISDGITVGRLSTITNNIISGPLYGGAIITNNTITGGGTWGPDLIGRYHSLNLAISTNESSIISNNTINGTIQVVGGSAEISNNVINVYNSTNGDAAIDIISGSPLISNNIIIGGGSLYDSVGRYMYPYSAIDIKGGTPIISNNTITSPVKGTGYGITTEISSNSAICSNTILGYARGIDAVGITLIQGNLIEDNSGGIAIGKILFAYNTVILGSNVTIRDNVFTNNGIGIGGGPVLGSNVGVGTNSEAGIVVIERNLITNGIQGINVESKAIIQNNTISNNSIGIQNPNSSSTIVYNNIQNNSQYSISISTSKDINATYNYWGTTDTQTINQTIHDFKDDFNLGTVIFVPYLTEPNTEAEPNASAIGNPNTSPTSTPLPSQSAYPSGSPSQNPTSIPTPSPNLPQYGITELLVVILVILVVAIVTVIALVIRERKFGGK